MKTIKNYFLKSTGILAMFCAAVIFMTATENANAQQCYGGGCSGGNSYGGALSTSSATFVSAMSCTYLGEYNTFNVTLGHYYEWSMCPTDGASPGTGDDQLTLRQTDGVTVLCYSDDACDGAHAKIGWTATFTGQVQVLITQYYCSFNSVCNTMVWRDGGSPTPSY